TLTVNDLNAAPTVMVSSPMNGATYNVGSIVTALAMFTDPGASDTHTCLVVWGDNSQSTGTISDRNHSCSAVHQYAAPSPVGRYQITFRIADNGVPVAVGTASATITVRGTSSSSAST